MSSNEIIITLKKPMKNGTKGLRSVAELLIKNIVRRSVRTHPQHKEADQEK
jgi:hypothetical protein